jgi:nitroimidazol reductase NimA-like FMN-containing flavoprotein (pyridoxamine 5'-phosphate oxidase superfamily)
MKSRTIKLQEELDRIILNCDVCYIGMIDQDNEPYVLPFNFGYRDKTIYLHSAKAGKKIDILKNNSKVCAAFSTDHKLRWVNEEVACSWGMKYRSVLAYGRVVFIDDYDEKVDALNVIMGAYSERKFEYSKPAVNDVQAFKVVVEKMEGRVYGY